MFHPTQLWLSQQLDSVRNTLKRPVVYRGYPQPVPESESRTVVCRPALFDPDHLSRVTKCGFGKTLPRLIDIMNATSYVEAPLTTYDLGEATVIGGTIFTRTGRFRLSHLVECRLRDTLSAVPVQDEIILVNSMQGLRYFGHWLSDDVSAFEAYRGDPRVRSLPLPAWGDVAPYLDLFGQDWNQQMVMRTRSLRIARDLGFSARKADRYRSLRQRLRARMGTAGGTGKVVFLKRGPSGARREIVNTAELEQRLADAGVAIIQAEGGKDFIHALLDATVIIAVEGSQACHAIYTLRNAGSLLVLEPPDRFYAAPHEWMRILDLNCGVVVGTVAEGGFVIDPDEVLAMVDRLLARSENREAV